MLDGMSVLVVEDHYYLAEEMRHMVHCLGGSVLAPVNFVTDALDVVNSLQVDAAILDLNLNGETSYRVADLLLTKNVPFAFATGYDAAEIDQRYAVIPHVEKPVTLDLLAKALAEAISAKGAHKVGLSPPDDELLHPGQRL